MTQIFMCRMLIEIESLPVNHNLRKKREKKDSPIVIQISFLRMLQHCRVSATVRCY